MSRYQFAKQELAYKLYNKFKSLKILEISVIKDKRNNPDIRGSKITKILFKFLIYLNLIKSINNTEIKKLIINKNNNNNNLIVPKRLKPIFLKIPRSLLLDRILRFIVD